MARKKAEESVEISTIALGDKKSDLAKSTAIEAKVSKADMTNIIRQNLITELEKDIQAVRQKSFDIDRKIGEHIESIKPTIKAKYLALLSEYGVLGKDEYLKVNQSIDKDRNIAFEGHYNRPAPIDIEKNFEKEIKSSAVFVYTEKTNRSYEDGSRLRVSLPNLYLKDQTYIDLLKEKDDNNKVIQELNTKMEKFTDTNYLRAQLDMGILAGTTNGESVVRNINLLSKAILEGNTPKLLN